jgi:hypothetical protein
MKNILLFIALIASCSASYLPSQLRARTIAVPVASIATSGSPADITAVDIPSDVTSYVVTSVYAASDSAAGTLAAATIDLRTASGGGGSSLLASPTALTGLTANSLVQSITPAVLGAKQTAGTIHLRQTVNSLNAGTIRVYVTILVLN